MPQRDNTPEGYNTYMAAPPPPETAAGFFENLSDPATWKSAFHLENDIYNALDLATRPTYEPDPTFNPGKWLKDNNLWEYRDNFLDVQSTPEAQALALRIKSEEEDRKTLEQAGWAGTVASVGAGLLSPTMFLPLVGEGRGLKAFGTAAAYGLFGGAVQEIPLQMAQETRTGEESALSIGAQTVLSGILGGVAKNLPKEQLQEMAAALRADMANGETRVAIPQAAGAAPSRAADSGKFASSFGAVDIAKRISPVLRTIQQDTSPQTRWMASQISDAGLTKEGNALGIPTAPLGTAENLTKTWYGNYYKGVKAIDENYAAFVFDGDVPALAPNLRALVRGTQLGGEKSKAAFREEISRAMRNGDKSDNPYTEAAAKTLRKEVYDPLLAEAQKLGIIPAELQDLADPSYLFRDYNRRAIDSNYKEFHDILANHFEGKYQEDFAKKADNVRAAIERDNEKIDAIKMSEEDVAKKRAEIDAKMAALEDAANNEHLNALEDSIANLRSQARALNGATLPEETQKKQMLADAREMERSGGEALLKLRSDKAALRRSASALNRAQVVLEARAQAKLAKIDAAEENSRVTLKRLVKKASKLLGDLDNLSDAAFEKRIEELKGLFMAAGEAFDKGEERLVKLAKDEANPEVGRLLALDAVQAQRGDKLTAIAKQLEDVEGVDRADVRAIVEDGLNEVFAKAQGIVERRAVRNARLLEQAKKLSPDEINARIAEIQSGRAEKIRAAEAKIKGENVDLANGMVDFKKQAADDAESVIRKILGVQLRLPAFDIMQGERGPTISRALADLPSASVEKFLENDIEKVTKSYLRTVAPDVEMARKFGTVNAQEQFLQLLEEEHQKKLTAKEDFINAAKAKKGGELSPEELKKLEAKAEDHSRKLADEYKQHRADLATMIDRLRNTRGLPENPDGMAYRLGRIALNLNGLRLLGGTLLASVADTGMVVMKHGLLNTMKEGWLPLISNFKNMRLSMEEVKLAGGGLDVVLHGRTQGLMDLMDNMHRGTKFEKGLDWASHHMGLIAGFDQWTAFGKQLTGVITIARLMKAVKNAAEGKLTAKEVTFLNASGIDAERARDIWVDALQNDGANKVNGVWLPNTESWKNPDNVRVFRAAIMRSVDNTIVTPGLERASFMDSNIGWRLVSQFKGFAMSSTSKVLLAGLQQRDMAVMNGIWISLAMGALSYYTWARAVGGDAEAEMMNAGPGKWADEAIDRSGLLGLISNAQHIAESIPATQPYASFSGRRSTRRGGDNLLEASLGPTADLANDAFKVLTTFDDATQGTAHAFRQMLPLQNFFLIRQWLDAIEQATGLPERRQ